MDRKDEVLLVTSRHLGDFEVVADRSWELGLAVVLEVISSGRTAVVKGHAEARRFRIEAAAYEGVVPAISDRAPALWWVDEPGRVIATTRLPGVPPADWATTPAAERAIHRDAGTVLRRLHSAQPAVGLPGWAEAKIEGFERWVAEAPDGVLDAGDVSFARSQVSMLEQCEPPVGVTCHGDWQPRNWLVDEDGTVRTFDFERVRTEWWCHDLQRMWWGEWLDRPDLAEAHFEGYDRAPTDDEMAMLMATSAATHITQIVWATKHGDADFAEAGRRHLRALRSSKE